MLSRPLLANVEFLAFSSYLNCANIRATSIAAPIMENIFYDYPLQQEDLVAFPFGPPARRSLLPDP